MNRRQAKARAKRRHGRQPSRRCASAAGGLTAAGALVIAPAAQADDFTVDNTLDAGAGSLRAALTGAAEANSAGGDRVLFTSGLSGTLTLASDLPTIDGPLELVGPGAGRVTISGADARRILDIDTSFGDFEQVTISGLTLDAGRTAANDEDGGAIRSRFAALRIADARITGSDTTGTASAGGGIFASEGSLTVVRSTISATRPPRTTPRPAASTPAAARW